MKIPERAIVRVSACGIFAEPTFKSEMVNQALMWEEVLISDKKDNWYKIQLEHDGYSGWINKMYLSFSERIIDLKKKYPLFTLSEHLSNNSFTPFVLSAGTRVPCTSFKGENLYGDEISFLIFFDSNDPWHGYDHIYEFKMDIKHSPYSHYAFIKEPEFEGAAPSHMSIEVAIENQLVNTFRGRPYLWGGRSYMGYDCSGLIQAIFRLVHFDYDFPRDAKDQVNYNALIDVDSTDEIQSEDLLFFKKGGTVDHVAIATMGYNINDAYVCDSDYDKLDKGDLIMHASGHKGIVCYQSLDDSGLKDSLYKIKRHVSKTL